MKSLSSRFILILCLVSAAPWPRVGAAQQVTPAPETTEAYPTILLPLMNDDAQNAKICQAFSHAFSESASIKLKDLNATLDRGTHEGHFNNLKAAKVHFNKGKKHYEDGNYPSALYEFEMALELYEKSFSFLERPQDFVDTLVYFGVATGMSGVQDNAVLSFKRAIIFRPDATYDFSRFPPLLKTLFERAKSELEQAGRGSLLVATVPPSAEVYVNGHFKGISPVQIDNLPEGRNYVNVAKVGYSKWNGIFKIKAGQTREEFITLSDARRKVLLNSLLPKIKEEIEKGKSVESISELQSLFFIDHVIFLQIRGVAKQRDVALTLYNMTEKRRLAQHSQKVDWTTFNPAEADLIVKAFLKNVVMEEKMTATTQSVVAEDSIINKWWFWTIIGVAVAGGVTTAVILTTQGEEIPLDGLPKEPGTGGIVLRF